MAKLPEGMTQKRGTYSTTYFYKGVALYRCSYGYEYRKEYLHSESGQILVRDAYAGSMLRNSTKAIDTELEDERYEPDARGILCLKDWAKAELLEESQNRLLKELAEVTDSVTEWLREGDYAKVESGAKHLQTIKKKLERRDANQKITA